MSKKPNPKGKPKAKPSTTSPAPSTSQSSFASSSGSKTKTGAKAVKDDDMFLILRDLRPGETICRKPAPMEGEFRVGRQVACRMVQKYGILREGRLLVFQNKTEAQKNRLWRMYELSTCKISYRARDTKMLISTNERFRLKVKKAQFQNWVDSFRRHRLFAQAKASGTLRLVSAKAPAPESSPESPAPVGGLAEIEPPVESKVPSERLPSPSPSAAVAMQESVVTKAPEAISKRDDTLPVQPSTRTALTSPEEPKALPRETPKSLAIIPSPKKTEGSKEKEPKQPTKETIPVKVDVLPKEAAQPLPAPAPSIQPSVAIEPKLPIAADPSPPSSPPLPVQAPTPPPPEIVEVPEPPAPKETGHADERKHDEQKDKSAGSDERKSGSGGGSALMANETALAVAARPLRKKLPAPMSPPPSLFKLIMSAIGKDIMRMALPASVMEPINTLQMMCEELEYSDLIDAALTKSEAEWRMLYVAAFAMSRYGAYARRANRKPFNPLLGETYEYTDARHGWRFISEQVSHHPPVAAMFAEGNGWRMWQDCELIASLSARAVKATPIGTVYLRLEKLRETYHWNKVVSEVSGILSGSYTMDNFGDMIITCQQTKLKCRLTFKKMSGQNRGEVIGQLTNAKNKVRHQLHGNWTESLFVGDKDDADSFCIWHLADLPKDAERYYGLTAFGMTLNELRPDIHGVLPQTDSRLRPDQRALEDGKVNEADKGKRELEERQRQRRRVNETKKIAYSPAWFRPTGHKDPASGPRWQFTGEYWKAKKDGFKHSELLDLW